MAVPSPHFGANCATPAMKPSTRCATSATPTRCSVWPIPSNGISARCVCWSTTPASNSSATSGTPGSQLGPPGADQHQRRLLRGAGVSAANVGGPGSGLGVEPVVDRGVAVVPLQAPYIMSKHAVLAMTECLRLEVELAGQADRVHAQSCAARCCQSNIFEAAGGVETGDVPRRINARRCWTSRPRRWIRSRPPCRVRPGGGRRVLSADAAGLCRRRDDRTGRCSVPPPGTGCGPNAASTRLSSERTAARSRRRRGVASFGRVAPMRERGIEAVRATLESAPRPEMAEMADVEDRLIPARGRHSAADTPPVDGPIRARAGVLPRRRNGARDQPFLRAAGSALARRLGSHGRRGRIPPGPEHPAPAQFDDAYAAAAWVSQHSRGTGVDATRLAVIGDSAGGSLAAAVALASRDRGGPPICCQVLLYPGLDRDMAAASIVAMPDAPMLAWKTSTTCTNWPTREPANPMTPTAPRVRVGPFRIAGGDSGDRRMRPHPRLGRTLRPAPARRARTDHPHPLPRQLPRLLMRSDAVARGRLAVAEIGGLLRAKFAHPLPF